VLQLPQGATQLIEIAIRRRRSPAPTVWPSALHHTPGRHAGEKSAFEDNCFRCTHDI
jgi:hypothetical protein